MQTIRRHTLLLLSFTMTLATAHPAAAVRCDPTGSDATAITAARSAVASTCSCDGFATHRDYTQCAAQVVSARVQSGMLPRRCRAFVQRCARRSTCSQPGTVSCCRTSATGTTRCRIKRDAAACNAPVGGMACVGTHTSCCDACAAHGCAATLKTVFVILMENHNWSAIQGSASAPYINNTLLPMAAYTTQYFNPPGLHPSEPNYLWLEAGTGFGITNDADPSTNHQSSTSHLVTQLSNAGITWKAYQEDISGTVCPLTSVGRYAPKHCAMVFFDDVTTTNDPASATCIAHVRPYSELHTDLQAGAVTGYNFITPNLCNDMHDSCAPVNDPIRQGDTWLANEIPLIMASSAYQNDGAIFITWDEGVAGDGPIGMIVLSPHGKGAGYSNAIHYTHSSTLRTLQEIFSVTPLLGDAANATDLSDLFTTFP